MRGLFGTTMVALSLATAVQAQEPAKRASSPPPTPAPAPARPRVGYAATEAPAPTPAQVQPNYYYTPNGDLVSDGQFLVLSDGSARMNFGNGYERVVRACRQTVNAAEAQRNATGRDALGRILPPPGIAALLQAGTRGQVTGAAPARNVPACYRHDGRGRAEVLTTGF